VLAFAPRIPPRLLEALVRLDDRTVPIAEVCRRLGAEAERIGVPRPSYQRVRVLVHALRRVPPRPTTASVLAEIAFRSRPPEDLVDHLAGLSRPLPRRRPPRS